MSKIKINPQHRRRSFLDTLKYLNRSKKVSRSKSGTVAMVIILAIFAVFMALPLVYMVSNSFKPLNELFLFPPHLFPEKPTLKNFKDTFALMAETEVPFLRYIFNSVLVTAIGSAGHIIISSMCAFPLAKKNFPGKKLIFNLIVLSLMFNTAVTSIPNYLIMSALGWIDTYAALIVPAIGSSLGLYLMKQFMEQIPDSLLEAARIDGASQWRIFWQIVIPNVKSAWMTLLLLTVQILWPMGANNNIYEEELNT